MTKLETADDLRAAIARDRAIIFFAVNWVIQSRQSESLLQHAICGLPTKTHDVVFKIDVSDQRGEAWDHARRWLAKTGADVDGITYGGAGSLLFVLRGRPIRVIIHPASKLPDGITRADLTAAIDDFCRISATNPMQADER